jgi:hypothetical protein
MGLPTDTVYQVEMKPQFIETAIYSALATRSIRDNNPSPLALKIPNFETAVTYELRHHVVHAKQNRMPVHQAPPGPPSRANLRTILGPISSYSALVWQ